MYANYYGNTQQYSIPNVPPNRPPPMQQTGPQSNIVCANCTTLLLYPQGAQNVRCARCGEITPVPLSGGGNSAQLTCSNAQCRVTLMYPRGASQVQCSLCGNINNSMSANQIGHIICSCCHITLMYAFGAASVKCAVCNTVTPVNQQSITSAPSQQGQGLSNRADSGSGSSRPQQSQTVVIVNPPTLDADGNEVEDYVVGVTSATGQRAGEQPPNQARQQHSQRQVPDLI